MTTPNGPLRGSSAAKNLQANPHVFGLLISVWFSQFGKRKAKRTRLKPHDYYTEQTMVDTDDAVAAADKQMEERAARAKALLSQRYKGLRTDQVRYIYESFHTT